MDNDTYVSVKEKVLSTLTELGVITTSSLVEATQKLETLEKEGSEKSRLYLLKLVKYYASNCTACERHKQRINPTINEGSMDCPMLVYDYPTYVDTIAGNVISGMPEILLSKMGNSANLGKYFKDCVYPTNKVLIPDPENFDLSYVKDLVQIQLPASLQKNQDLAAIASPGQILDRILLDLNLTRDKWSEKKPTFYITSSLLCPNIKEDGTNAAVKVGQRKACSPWLDLQIEIVNPPIIICLGSEAMASFYNYKTTMSEVVGSIKTIKGRDVGVTWHPSTVLRKLNNKTESDKYYEDIKSHLSKYLKEEE